MRVRGFASGTVVVALVVAAALAVTPGVASAEVAQSCSGGDLQRKCLALSFHNEGSLQGARARGWINARQGSDVRIRNVAVQVRRSDGSWRFIAVSPDNDGWFARDTGEAGWVNTLCGDVYRAQAVFNWRKGDVRKKKVVRTVGVLFNC
jgi:hypothetical protein